jgi:hypothetical protein
VLLTHVGELVSEVTQSKPLSAEASRAPAVLASSDAAKAEANRGRAFSCPRTVGLERPMEVAGNRNIST